MPDPIQPEETGRPAEDSSVSLEGAHPGQESHSEEPTSSTDSFAVERALDCLARAWDPQSATQFDSTDAEARPHLAALAALAYDLEPTTPSTATREAILARVRAESEPAPLPFSAPSGAGESASPIRDRDPAEVALPATAIGPSNEPIGQSSTVVPISSARPASRGWATWAMAAGLAFCLLGLGYTFGQLGAKDSVIALQQERLEAVPELEAELRLAREDLRRAQDQLVMVNTTARTAYTMRQVSTSPELANAPYPAGARGPRGRVFVCGAHQQWYLTLSNLEPAPRGQEYNFWFMTDSGPVNGGDFEVENGSAVLRDLRMPDGTSGFAVTLEPADSGDAPNRAPHGQTILIGDDPVSL